MTSRRSALAACMTIFAVALAGCASDVEEPPIETGDELIAADGRDLRTELTGDDDTPGPTWTIGNWFGHHVFLGSEDPEGIHINAIVYEDGGDVWKVATDNEEMAKIHAVFDIPILGDIRKADIGGTSFGDDYSIYDFPLRDGKTWSASIFGEDYQFSATFNDAIKTPYGIRPGYDIVGMNQDGDVEIVTDYVPDIGWYSQFTWYRSWTEDPEDYELHVISMGRGEGWSGVYHVHEATPLISSFSHFFPADDPGSAQDAVQHHVFDVPEGADSVFGYAFVFAVAGGATLRFLDPENTEYDYTAYHVPDGADPDAWTFGFDGGDLWEIPAVTGAWNVAAAQAGFVAGLGMELWSLDKSEYVM